MDISALKLRLISKVLDFLQSSTPRIASSSLVIIPMRIGPSSLTSQQHASKDILRFCRSSWAGLGVGWGVGMYIIFAHRYVQYVYLDVHIYVYEHVYVV